MTAPCEQSPRARGPSFESLNIIRNPQHSRKPPGEASDGRSTPTSGRAPSSPRELPHRTACGSRLSRGRVQGAGGYAGRHAARLILDGEQHRVHAPTPPHRHRRDPGSPRYGAPAGEASRGRWVESQCEVHCPPVNDSTRNIRAKFRCRTYPRFLTPCDTASCLTPLSGA
jgi:hypothetical protein